MDLDNVDTEQEIGLLVQAVVSSLQLSIYIFPNQVFFTHYGPGSDFLIVA